MYHNMFVCNYKSFPVLCVVLVLYYFVLLFVLLSLVP